MPKTYEGNCHCGNIKYTVTLPEALAPEGTGKIMRCNCSICTRNGLYMYTTLANRQVAHPDIGYFLVYPKREDVVFLDGSESRMKDYLMGKKIKPRTYTVE
jgi:hypothetical protein